MPAMLGRYHFTEAGFPVAEYLHRTETLFVEPEFSWSAERAGALIFPDQEAAEAAAPAHRYRDASGEHVPMVVICAGRDRAALERREADRVAQALLGERPTPNVQRPTSKDGEETVEIPSAVPQRNRYLCPTEAGDREAPGMHQGAAGGKRLRRAKAKPAVPPARLDVLKEVYRTRVAGRHVSPEESYAELERRHLD